MTSDFHMLRTRAIFDTTYNLAPPRTIATNGSTSTSTKPRFELSYHPVSDIGLFEDQLIGARTAKEVAAVERWHKDSGRFKSLADLHQWLFATHLCYSVSRQHEFGVKDDLDPKLAATY